jgi:hypothetical protein
VPGYGFIPSIAWAKSKNVTTQTLDLELQDLEPLQVAESIFNQQPETLRLSINRGLLTLLDPIQVLFMLSRASKKFIE